MVDLDNSVIRKSKVRARFSLSLSFSLATDPVRSHKALRRRETELKAKLAEIHKAKPRGNPDEVLTAEITRCESDLTLVRDDSVSCVCVTSSTVRLS